MSDDAGGYEALAGSAIKTAASVDSLSAKENLENANAGIAAAQAKSEMVAGGYNANLIRQRTAQKVGAITAQVGGNNLQQGGTPATLEAQTARAGEQSALTENNNALRRAWGFSVQGASDTYQAKLAGQQQDFDEIGGAISAASAWSKG